MLCVSAVSVYSRGPYGLASGCTVASEQQVGGIESWTVRFPHYGTEPFDVQSGRTSVDHLALGDAGQDRGTDELTP